MTFVDPEPRPERFCSQCGDELEPEDEEHVGPDGWLLCDCCYEELVGDNWWELAVPESRGTSA